MLSIVLAYIIPKRCWLADKNMVDSTEKKNNTEMLDVEYKNLC